MTTRPREPGPSGCTNTSHSCGSSTPHEILGKAEIGTDGLLLNIVTGGGKTADIAAIIAWSRIAHDVQKFVMLCPNLIVRDRLEDDFEGGKVFRERDPIPDWSHCGPKDFLLTTLGNGKEGGWASLFSASVIRNDWLMARAGGEEGSYKVLNALFALDLSARGSAGGQHCQISIKRQSPQSPSMLDVHLKFK